MPNEREVKTGPRNASNPSIADLMEAYLKARSRNSGPSYYRLYEALADRFKGNNGKRFRYDSHVFVVAHDKGYFFVE